MEDFKEFAGRIVGAVLGISLFLIFIAILLMDDSPLRAAIQSWFISIANSIHF